MALSLRARLFSLHALVVATVLAIVTALAIREQRGWLIERHFEDMGRRAATMAEALRAAPPAGADGIPGAADSLGHLIGARVTLIDSAGRVLGDSEVPRASLAGIENHAVRPEVGAALAGREGRAGRRSRTVGQNLLYVAVPVRGVPDVAVLRLAEPVALIAGLEGSLVRLALVAAGLALLLSFPLVLWVTGRHAARLAGLERAALRLASGDATARAREQPADEIGRLGRAINAMAVERRARLEALGRERDERERILAHMSDGVALLDAQGRVEHMNRRMAELLARPLPAASGTRLAEFARAPELEDLLERARALGRGVEAEIRMWAPWPRLVYATVTPLAAPEPGGGSMLVVIHDLSELEALNRVRQDFVANAAHELRTPLTSLRGYADTLLDGALEDREHREGFVRVIRDQAVRLEALVADLLSLSELERPGATLRPEPFDLREAAERMVMAQQPQAASAGLRLDIEPGPPLPVTADRQRIEQVLANLLDNGLKYTERGGVTVRLGTESAGAWCEIEDTGVGIPAESLPRVFERFYRVEKARFREKGGTGLGLSIVKHVMTLHGGEVTVRSEPGVGTRFRFVIPHHPAAAVFPSS